MSLRQTALYGLAAFILVPAAAGQYSIHRAKKMAHEATLPEHHYVIKDNFPPARYNRQAIAGMEQTIERTLKSNYTSGETPIYNILYDWIGTDKALRRITLGVFIPVANAPDEFIQSDLAELGTRKIHIPESRVLQMEIRRCWKPAMNLWLMGLLAVYSIKYAQDLKDAKLKKGPPMVGVLKTRNTVKFFIPLPGEHCKFPEYNSEKTAKKSAQESEQAPTNKRTNK